MIKPLTVPAGKSVVVNVTGRYFRCRESSAAFQLKVASDTYTLEGGDEFTVREADMDFTALKFTNLSATVALLVDFFAGINVVRNAYVKLPRTNTVGRDVTLASNASQTFPGVVDGKRRKQFTMTMAGVNGVIEVRNADTLKLLSLVRAATTTGSGFAIETDDNLTIKNRTGEGITSEGATPDFAIAETFYR